VGNRRCLLQEPVRLVTVLTHDAVRVVEERLTGCPCISLRRLSREIDLRQIVFEQPADEITAGFIPVSAPVSIPQYTCEISGISIGFIILCGKEFMWCG